MFNFNKRFSLIPMKIVVPGVWTFSLTRNILEIVFFFCENQL